MSTCSSILSLSVMSMTVLTMLSGSQQTQKMTPTEMSSLVVLRMRWMSFSRRSTITLDEEWCGLPLLLLLFCCCWAQFGAWLLWPLAAAAAAPEAALPLALLAAAALVAN